MGRGGFLFYRKPPPVENLPLQGENQAVCPVTGVDGNTEIEMFDVIRNNKRIAQVILAILIVPFAAFGLDAYFGGGRGGEEVARINGAPIYQSEFDRILREQEAAALDERMRQELLDQLVTNRVLALYAGEARLTVGSEPLRQQIAQDANFQEDGRFSPQRYQTWLAKRRISAAAYEAAVAQSLRLQQLDDAVAGASVAAKDSVRRLLAARLEKRMVREMRFPVGARLGAIQIDEAAIQAYYDAHPARFVRPERVQAEYLVLDEETLAAGVETNEAEILQSYDAGVESKALMSPETRRARHILIEVAPDADEAAVAKAQAQADEVAGLLRKHPARFAELARQRSQDPGSKDSGGDLGYFRRGQMVQEFEDAVFAQEKEAIGPPVRSSFGFHVIQVTDIRPEAARPLSEVRDDIVASLRREAAVRRFNEWAGQFSDIVFEQFESLEPAAREFNLKIERSGWIERGAPGIGKFRSAALMDELFSDNAIDQRHNTRAVEAGINALVAARVVEHEAARRLPLEEVRAQIEAQLRRDEAHRQAREAGEAALAALDKGEKVAGGTWSEPRAFQRGSPSLPPQAAQAIFAVSPAKLPARVGVELPDDAYAIYRIDSIEHPAFADDDPRLERLTSEYERLLAQYDFSAFRAALRARYKVETHLPPRGEAAE
jgi:peptidyl-prolyl cis-trans isomerase D